MTLHTAVHLAGTRVVVQRGRFPMDPDLLERAGVVVELSDYRPQRYGVVLDGEEQVRDFHESELRPADG
jgi:hypothetical protein